MKMKLHHGGLSTTGGLTSLLLLAIIIALPQIQQLINNIGGPNHGSFLVAAADELSSWNNDTYAHTRTRAIDEDIPMDMNMTAVEDGGEGADPDLDLQGDGNGASTSTSTSTFTNKNNNAQCYPKFCSNGNNCANKNCRGCPYNCWRSGDTDQTCAPVRSQNRKCKTWCTGTPAQCANAMCADCLNCLPNMSSSSCPLGHFQDVTGRMMPSMWDNWGHSGKPFTHFTSPVMVDINGDSILDYFTSMHVGDTDMYERMEFGLAQKTTQSVLGKMINMTSLTALQGSVIMEEREDEKYKYLDCHGDNIVDLDNDGVLDLYVSSGGGRGRPIENPMSRDNFLFFGEYDSNNNNRLTFRGGRKRALDAGVGLRNGRGKFNYLLDVNQDGLLDIFSAHGRRVDNSLVPAVLLINQGGRKWKEDTNMREFASAMMLTDADGDGRPEEFMIIRDSCFPDRNDPDKDDEFGPFSNEIKKFCSTRPVGTIAIYKYNQTRRIMEEISQRYTNISADKTAQKECCPHGLWGGENDCSAVSMASADVDGDMRSDHVILYGTKLVFYFSSERPVGTLPDNVKYIGLTIPLPSHCNKGVSVRFVDLNNNSRQDLLVVCKNVGTFLIYSQDKQGTKDSWHLKDGCNDRAGRLGDLTRFSSYELTDADVLDACARRDLWESKMGEICDTYTNRGKKMTPITMGMTLADVNNDGLTDAIVVGSIGYQKVFLNTPSGHQEDSNGNRFVSFRLEGDGIEVNKYGIGVTLRLFTVNVQDGNQRKIQFREISSYQHYSDTGGSIDEKVIFGLGENWKPMKLEAVWPNGRKQIVFLKRFDLSSSVSYSSSMVEPIQVRYPPKDNQYFRIENLKSQQSSGEKLCLSLGPGDDWKNVEVSECNSESPRQSFRFDLSGRLRSLLYNDYCVIPQYTDYSVVMHLCMSPKAKGRSWHLTRDGSIFRQAGSSLVLAVVNAKPGEKAKLLSLDRSKTERGWVIQKVQV